MHWNEMVSRDIRRFNAFQQARYEWVLKVAQDVHGKKVLDVGCGDGALSFVLAKAGADIVGVDNQTLGIEFAKENMNKLDIKHTLHYNFLVASAYELPFPDNTFDVVVSCEVIEHVLEPERMIREMHRVAKVGARVILTTPHRHHESPTDPNHVIEYFPVEFKKLMQGFFSEVEIKLTHHIMWYGIFSYASRKFQNRQFGKWFLNAMTLWFGYNPFMIEYPKSTKQDLFMEIVAIGIKQ